MSGLKPLMNLRHGRFRGQLTALMTFFLSRDKLEQAPFRVFSGSRTHPSTWNGRGLIKSDSWGPALGLGWRCVHKAGPRGAQHHQHEASPAREGPGGQSGLPGACVQPSMHRGTAEYGRKIPELAFFFWFAFLKVVRVRFIYSRTPLGRQGRLHLPVQGVRVRSLVEELRSHKPQSWNPGQ